MSGDVDSIYYTYHRDLHSFDMYLTYKDSHKNNNNQWKSNSLVKISKEHTHEVYS